MKPIYYSTCSKETTAENKKNHILRECRDLNALIKENLCYIPYEQRTKLLTEIKSTLSILDSNQFGI